MHCAFQLLSLLISAKCVSLGRDLARYFHTHNPCYSYPRSTIRETFLEQHGCRAVRAQWHGLKGIFKLFWPLAAAPPLFWPHLRGYFFAGCIHLHLHLLLHLQPLQTKMFITIFTNIHMQVNFTPIFTNIRMHVNFYKYAYASEFSRIFTNIHICK